MIGSAKASRHKTELAAKATKARTVRDAVLVFGLDDLDIQLPRQDAIPYMPRAMQLLPLGYLLGSQTSWFGSSELTTVASASRPAQRESHNLPGWVLATLFDFQNFDFIHDHSVRRDEILDASFPIPEMRTDFYPSFTALSHALDAVVDAGDQFPIADSNLTKMVFLNLLALVQPTVQTDLNGIALFDGLASARRFRKKFDTGLKLHLGWT